MSARSYNQILIFCALIILSCACSDKGEEDCTPERDEDGDGYCGSDDCDLQDASIHPGATDRYQDGLDQDCDGADGTDGDGDGYPPGDVDVTDCDDNDASVSPNATERCDGVDNDCDEVVDEDDAEDASTWYVDADGDGHGAASDATSACDQPDGYVSSSDDCDDGAAELSPDKDETLYDGLDNDCDVGTLDDDLDEDGYALEEDCDDEDPSRYPGAAEICEDGVVNDCQGSTAASMADCGLGGELSLGDADAVFSSSEEGYRSGLGVAVTGGGDMNGDGPDELLIGAPGVTSASIPGSVHVVTRSDADGTLSTWARLVGDEDGDQVGTSLAVGAFDEDDAMLIVGAIGVDAGGEDAGAVYVVLDVEEGETSLSDSASRLTGYGPGDLVGSSVAAAGDLAGDGDGYDDLIVGAPMLNDVPTNGGGAYVELGPVTADLSLSEGTQTGRLVGEVDGDYAGTSVAGGADTNGDGVDDLLVSGVGHSESGGPAESGAAYLVQGPVSASVLSLGDVGERLQGVAAEDAAGAAVAFAGDVDGDGFDDALIGATGWSSSRGLVYLVLGPVTASGSLSEAENRFRGEEEDATLGQSISAGGDVDGDGSNDLVIGAPGSGDGAGAAYLILGPLADASDSVSDAQVKLVGVETGDRAGEAVCALGDLNGDGLHDLLVGAPLVDLDGLVGDLGFAYVIFGGGY